MSRLFSLSLTALWFKRFSEEVEWLAEITWFGHSAFKIEMANRIVLVDPWLDESPSSPVKSLDITRADVVHMTYDHTDHLGDALSVCRRTSAMLMATRGGLIEVGMAHASVMMFGFPFFPIQETSTVCIGWRSL
jgi:hypothetical protein